MFEVIQKEERFNEVFLNYFKENKIEIARAITRPFPFLESLRDRSFITDKVYADSYEAYRNLVPVEKVVYNVLSHLEKLSDSSLLWALFSRVNLKEYPALREIQKSLEIELQHGCSPQRSKQEEQKRATVQPRYEQGTNLCTHENWTQPCFVKQENLQEPETRQNQVDEIIAESAFWLFTESPTGFSMAVQ
ncbi:nuclear body protein SP140-like protein isoform X2 [Apodemus sylvaticus]|uniref:nuclear body protein SP140-like protein isoform X2 n=1 Tax=Apodemus sylvaticus TaxID=10129 RepID=UPI002243759F|nr:nuclear body protein SP140-like protein isoform X2 [Apodemus sylvaticus]